jgi:hypothetical protein
MIGPPPNSHDKNPTGPAGIGIHITYQNTAYFISIAVGIQSVLFTEMTAIAYTPQLLRRLNIPYRTSHLCFVTDSKISYDYIFGSSADPPYPTITQEIQSINNALDCTFIKVPAHEDRFNRPLIHGNNEADKLATAGTNFSSRHYQQSGISIENCPIICYSSPILPSGGLNHRYGPKVVLWRSTVNNQHIATC